MVAVHAVDASETVKRVTPPQTSKRATLLMKAKVKAKTIESDKVSLDVTHQVPRKKAPAKVLTRVASLKPRGTRIRKVARKPNRRARRTAPVTGTNRRDKP